MDSFNRVNLLEKLFKSRIQNGVAVHYMALYLGVNSAATSPSNSLNN
jgi:hypothetical protein